MNWHFTMLLGASLVASTVVMRAADPTEKRSESEQTDQQQERGKSLSSAERDAKMKEGRKTNAAPPREEWEKRREQFQKMTAEEREAKRKEIKGRLEKRIAELRARQTNATITAQESRELDRREQILKRFESEGPNVPRAKPILTNSPSQN